jgi:hypothetical protein
VFSSWHATIAKADNRLSLIGMPTYACVRPEAQQGHVQGWHR